MIDVHEVKLNLRYPESRQEDITDAFMRGYTNAVEIGNRAIVKLESENERLRELVRIAVQYCDSGTCDGCPIQVESGSCPYSDMARGLGVEVDG